MTRNRFEAINTFFHVATPQEEASNPNDPLKKVRSFNDHVKKRCSELYQPLKQLSVDERMVKSKARTHFRQYIRNKPTKWGFKYWVLADPTGFTSDFNLYCGRRGGTVSENGLAYDVVTELLLPYHDQGYSVFFDNLYTSPTLLHALKRKHITATGTLRTNRQGIPRSVHDLKDALSRSDVPRGTGFYICDQDDIYVCWRDNNCVCVMSNEYPGHQDGTVQRSGKNSQGVCQVVDVPLPSAIKHYNLFMGGVDKSDQLISYHCILRQTKKYWKTLFYHLLEICITNAAVLNKWMCMESGSKAPTMNEFRDDVVMAIIEQFGGSVRSQILAEDFVVRHGSTPIPEKGKHKKCAVCHKLASRYCPDCPFGPALCQTSKRDCHQTWHTSSYSAPRTAWFAAKKRRTERPSVILHSSRKRAVGRPMGSKKKRRSRVRN